MIKLTVFLGYILIFISCVKTHNNKNLPDKIVQDTIKIDTITTKKINIEDKPDSIEIIKSYSKDSLFFSYIIKLGSEDSFIEIKTVCLNYNEGYLAYDYPVVNQELRFLFNNQVVIDSNINIKKIYREIDSKNKLVNYFIIRKVMLITTKKGFLIYITGTDNFISREFFSIYNKKGKLLWSIYCEQESARVEPQIFGNLDSLKQIYNIKDLIHKKIYNSYYVYPVKFAGNVKKAGVIKIE